MYQDQAPNLSGFIDNKKGMDVIMNNIIRFYICFGNQTCRKAQIWVLVPRVQVQAVLTLFRVPRLQTLQSYLESGLRSNQPMTYNSSVLEQLKIVSPNTPNQAKPLLLPTQGPVTSQNDNLLHIDVWVYSNFLHMMGTVPPSTTWKLFPTTLAPPDYETDHMADVISSPTPPVITSPTSVQYGNRRSQRTSNAPIWMKDYAVVVQNIPSTSKPLSKNGIVIPQRNYTLEIISKVGAAKPATTPLDPYLTTKEFDEVSEKGNTDSLLKDPSVYKRLIRKFLYLIVTRPDISFAIQILSLFLQKPKKSHLNVALRVVKLKDDSFIYLVLYVDDMLIAAKKKYGIQKLKGLLSAEFEMKDLGAARKILGMEIIRDRERRKLFLSQRIYTQKGRDDTQCLVTGYSDSDYAGDVNTRRSVTGYVFTLGGSVVSLKATLQPTVTLSTMEAEYMALTEAAKEGIWMKGLFSDLDSAACPHTRRPITGFLFNLGDSSSDGIPRSMELYQEAQLKLSIGAWLIQ
uniref:Reverse transcriptase Ty1/copia-type domain-containing protein n=1 Tax=Solanum lycopersicum TaxID=4081 RepID=A0A3Q7G4H6_SOLLC